MVDWLTMRLSMLWNKAQDGVFEAHKVEEQYSFRAVAGNAFNYEEVEKIMRNQKKAVRTLVNKYQSGSKKWSIWRHQTDEPYLDEDSDNVESREIGYYQLSPSSKETSTSNYSCSPTQDIIDLYIGWLYMDTFYIIQFVLNIVISVRRKMMCLQQKSTSCWRSPDIRNGFRNLGDGIFVYGKTKKRKPSWSNNCKTEKLDLPVRCYIPK